MHNQLTDRTRAINIRLAPSVSANGLRNAVLITLIIILIHVFFLHELETNYDVSRLYIYVFALYIATIRLKR